MTHTKITPEMIEAAEEAYMPFGDMGLAIQCALAAAQPQPEAAPVPQGWKLVPIEATQEMVDAWSSATELPEGVAEQADDAVNTYAARRDWKAMLAASPETKAYATAMQKD